VGPCPCCPPGVQPLPLLPADWFAALHRILPKVFGLPITVAGRPGRKLFVTLKASARISILCCSRIWNCLEIHRECADIKRVRKPPHNGARIMPSKPELMGAANNAHVVVNSKICTV
jgi:hypothetical protein